MGNEASIHMVPIGQTRLRTWGAKHSPQYTLRRIFPWTLWKCFLDLYYKYVPRNEFWSAKLVRHMNAPLVTITTPRRVAHSGLVSQFARKASPAMRAMIILAGLVVNLHAAAQQWCPSGAEWRYPWQNVDPQFQPQGTLQYTYMGDSLFQGEVCQHFVSQVFRVDTSGNPHQSTAGHSFTSTSPGLIRYWNTMLSQPRFDTLVYFDAAPGTGWSFNLFTAPKAITVLDTGTNNVEGIPLRYVVVGSNPPWMHAPLPVDTIYERIGALYLHTFNPAQAYMVVDLAANSLGCYRDDEMEYVQSGYGLSCNSPVSVAEHVLNGDNLLLLYPNPGKDRLRVVLVGDKHDHQLTVHDISGRVMGQWSMYGSEKELNTAEWAPGIYLVELRNAWKAKIAAVWIKDN